MDFIHNIFDNDILPSAYPIDPGMPKKIETALASFGVLGKITAVTAGPVVTRYSFLPNSGVGISAVTSKADDLSLVLKARNVRIVPNPDEGTIAIEAPNKTRTTVPAAILEQTKFDFLNGIFEIPVGTDIVGKIVKLDLLKMPHAIIAGQTRSGKSVFINSIICAILGSSAPKDVRLILVDPKMVELTRYNNAPHLLKNVITSPEDALDALDWTIKEMERRYTLLAKANARDISSFNKKVINASDDLLNVDPMQRTTIPYIFVIIDEFADICAIKENKNRLEASVQRITQMARAAGIHLILATQRPSCNIISGSIKANIPTRIAFKLPTATDSKTVIDQGGAESLLGNGDMLLKNDFPIRIHAPFISEATVDKICNHFTAKCHKLDGWNEIDGFYSDSLASVINQTLVLKMKANNIPEDKIVELCRVCPEFVEYVLQGR